MEEESRFEKLPSVLLERDSISQAFRASPLEPMMKLIVAKLDAGF